MYGEVEIAHDSFCESLGLREHAGEHEEGEGVLMYVITEGVGGVLGVVGYLRCIESGKLLTELCSEEVCFAFAAE